jgi:murein DD-endopeptidase MepM/ murein hydrolase activator NlpD
MNRWLSLMLRMLCVTGLLGGPLRAVAAPPPNPPLALAGNDGVDIPHDELSPAAEQAMWDDIRRNVALLRSAGLLAAPDAAQTVTYNFPLQLAPGLPDYAGFRVSAFVDHDPSSGVVDYNGGARTYDGHRGTDYALWPFGWNKLDAGEMQVIAAAAGTIINKVDGDATDHNPCDAGSSNDNWNYVALLHADGRLTIYGHMRHGSLTSKSIGQTVAQGEYLGTAASSGNSSGPHLHFEARYGSFSNAEWIDPYAGPNSQAESLWANQRPYFDSAINRLATHSAPPNNPACPPSTPNLQDSFTTLSNIYLYAYYRDYQGVFPTQFTIYHPDGSPFQSQQYAPGNTFSSALSRAWVVNLPVTEPAGTWRFEAIYNGQTYQTFFNVNAPPTVTVSSPNGLEQWPLLFPHSVTWTDNFGGDVNIALYHNGVYSATIASNTPSDGEYLWTPDLTLVPGPGYTIRVTSVINPAIYDVSNGPFTLQPALLAARDDFALTSINTPVTIYALGNDTDPYGHPMTLTALGAPLSGTASIVGSSVAYTPTLGLGADVFTYTVSASSQTATATVTVLIAAQVFKIFLPLIAH